MDGNGVIRLDPDVAGADRAVNERKIPLSDLYELPVFTEETRQKAAECRRAERKMSEQIRKGIFDTDGRGEKERLMNIQSQIFQSVPKTVAEEGCLSRGDVSEGMIRHSLTGIAGETEKLPGSFLLPGVLLIGISLAVLRRKGKRRQ